MSEDRSIYQQQYRQNNRDKFKKYSAKYYLKNKDKINVSTSEYYEKNKEENKEKKKEYDRIYREKNRELMKARHKKRYAEHPEKFKEYNRKRREKHGNSKDVERAAKWKKNNPHKVRESALKRVYGIGSAYYNELLEKQNHCCAICGTHESAFKKPLYIDHCHNSKKVRGLLCRSCNVGLGFFKDKIELLSEAIKYLQSR